MQDKQGEHPFGDAGQLIFMGAFLIVWVGDSFFLHLSTFLAALVPLAVRLAILILSLIAAIFLFKSGHVAVSGNQRPHRVISMGAFRHVRHPLYLASILIYFGLTVSTCSLLAFALFVAICFYYNFLASYEEKLMANKFGEEYAEYRKKTGKWLPRLGKLGE